MHGDPLLEAVWSRLRRARASRIRAELHTADGPWFAGGVGALEVLEPEAGTLLLTERGTWTAADGGHTVSYRAAYRWTRVEDAIRLAHVRLGPDRPVDLGLLVPAAGGRLAAARPHLCGADRYEATLTVEGEAVRLVWRVRGPAKDQLVVHTYR